MGAISGGNSNTTGPDVLGGGDSAGVFDRIVSGGDSSSTYDDGASAGGTTPGTGSGGSTSPGSGSTTPPAVSLPGTPIPGGTSTALGEPILLDNTPKDHADRRRLWFESIDGSTRIDLNIDAERILEAGATGLELPPLDVVTATTPGMVGSWLQEVNTLEREVFLPLVIAHDTDQAAFLASMNRLKALVMSGVDSIAVGSTGTFNVVVSSPAGGERVLTVQYKSGLSGLWGGAGTRARSAKVGLVLVAVDPYFRARTRRVVPYRTSAGKVFLGTGDNTNPWPRQLSTSTVVGTDMLVTVGGDVPVWPSVDVIGQVSNAEILWAGTDVNVPNGVPSGQTLHVDLDPRTRSARLNGAIAWSRITPGAKFAPLVPGDNRASVNVTTAGDNSGLVLSWLEGWRSAW